MAEKLNFDLVSPERLVRTGEVDMVSVPGTEGDFAVLANHAPVISTLRPGLIGVHEGQGQPEQIFVRGGFAEVTPRGLTILAEEAIPVSELDTEALERQIKNAEEDVADAQDPERRQKAQEHLDHLRQLKTALSR